MENCSHTSNDLLGGYVGGYAVVGVQSPELEASLYFISRSDKDL